MSAILTNVTIVGAAGNLGSPIFRKLVASGKFNVQVLRRHGSTTEYPAGTKVVDVDFSAVEELAAVLKGQDAVIALFPGSSLDLQLGLVDASIKAGVKRFIPSEFGSDNSNANNRTLLPFVQKFKVADYLVEKAQTSDLTYTFMYTGPILDWGLEHHIILDTSEYRPVLLQGGDALFSTSTLDTVADSVIGVLTNPSATQNRAVYVSDLKTSQNELLSIAKKVAPSKPWQPKDVLLDDLTAEADKRVAQGIIDVQTILPYLLRSILDPAHGGNHQKNDNHVLGVKAKDKQIIEDVFAKILTKEPNGKSK